MNLYLCHRCASDRKLLGDIPSNDKLTANDYQLEKFIKHTIPSSCASYKTVFTGVGSESYQTAIVNTYLSGGVEIDKFDRVNIFWVGSEANGFAYEGGHVVGLTHGVKVALSHNQNKLHAFPIDAGQLRSEICMECGSMVML